MAKVIYETVINGVYCSIELLDGVDSTDKDEDVLGYTIGTTGGLFSGKDLAIYIVALETGYFGKLKKASDYKIAFVNDLVRQGVIVCKETYCSIYEDGGERFDFLTSE